jgi:hypothetical protein
MIQSEDSRAPYVVIQVLPVMSTIEHTWLRYFEHVV